MRSFPELTELILFNVTVVPFERSGLMLPEGSAASTSRFEEEDDPRKHQEMVLDFVTGLEKLLKNVARRHFGHPIQTDQR